MPTIDERARLELFTAVQDTLGASHADTLMSLLPPVGWADVATKHDLHELERRLELRFDARFDDIDRRFEAIDHRFEIIDHRFEMVDHRFEMLDHRFDSLEHKLTARIEQTARTVLITMVGTMMTLASLCLGAFVVAT